MWPSRRKNKLSSTFEIRPFYHKKQITREFAYLPNRMTSGKLVWLKYYYEETITYIIYYDETVNKLTHKNESRPIVINKFSEEEYFLLKLQEKG